MAQKAIHKILDGLMGDSKKLITLDHPGIKGFCPCALMPTLPIIEK